MSLLTGWTTANRVALGVAALSAALCGTAVFIGVLLGWERRARACHDLAVAGTCAEPTWCDLRCRRHDHDHGSDTLLVDAAEHQLAALKESAASMGLAAETTVTTGRPSQTIVDYAKDGGFDLIVMGTHGRTGLSHVVMGSIAERVLRKAPCPVLTVKAVEPTETVAKSAAA